MRRLLGLLILAALGFYVAWPAWSGYRIAEALSAKDAGGLEGKIDFPSVRESLRPVVTAEMGKRIDQEMRALGPLGQTLGQTLDGDMKTQMQGKLVDQMLMAIVTPDNVIRIAHEGGNIAATVEKILGEAAGQIGALTAGAAPGNATPSGGGGGGIGGMLGQVLGGATGGAPGGGGGDLAGILGKALGGMKKSADAAPAAPETKSGATPAKRSFGLGNLKGFGFDGPLAFYASVARDAAQPKADGTIGMSFTGGDWKLTRVVPNI